MPRQLRAAAPCLLLLALANASRLPAPAEAKDHFLTIGGGYSAAGNQISLESNVLFYQRMLADERPDAPPHEIYFADGDSPERDLQFLDTAVRDACPPAARIMTETFGRGERWGFAIATTKSLA